MSIKASPVRGDIVSLEKRPHPQTVLLNVNCGLNQMRNYRYKNPASWLRSLYELEPIVAASFLSDEARTLRTRELRRWHYSRQAALFAFGMSCRLPNLVFDFAIEEQQDYDAVVRWRDSHDRMFTPLQLKEFVPNERSGEGLNDLLQKLSKYVDSAEVVVSIYLNRSFRLAWQSLVVPRCNLGGIYLVGAIRPDRREWILIGDLIRQPGYYTIFTHP